MTRTERALSMQAEGRSSREIAQALGVSVSCASALLSSGHRAKKRGGNGTPTGRGRYGISTSELETTIMDLYEADVSRSAIAEQLGIRRETVDKIIGYMQVGHSELVNGPSAIARASAMLLDAIRRHHPERCGA